MYISKITAEEASRLRQEAIELGLHYLYPSIFMALTDQDLSKIYNGYGPDSWPNNIRERITWIYRHYQLLAFIHDFEFTFSDCTKEGWLMTLANWKYNSSILLNKKYPILSLHTLAFRIYETFSFSRYNNSIYFSK